MLPAAVENADELSDAELGRQQVVRPTSHFPGLGYSFERFSAGLRIFSGMIKNIIY